jgi:hypothetical protein
MPLTMPTRCVDEAFEAHAVFRRHDLVRIGGADRRDRPSRAQAAFQEADIAVIFQPVDGEGFRRQVELGKDIGAKLALEGEVVHGEDGGDVLQAGIAHVDGRHRRLPVVGMHDVRLPVGQEAAGDFGAGEGECGEALPVVDEILAGGIRIGPTRAIEEAGRIQHEDIETLVRGGENAGRLAEQVVEGGDHLDRRQALHDRRIAGHERAHVHSMPGERDRQCASDVGEASRLDEREYFGCHRKDIHQSARAPACRSSVG